MNKINLEFTSEEAEVLIPFFNNDLCWINEWADLIDEVVDYREVKFLEESIRMFRDAVVMKIGVVLEVQKIFTNTLIRLSANIALTREKTLLPEEFDMYTTIIKVISNGYKMLLSEEV